ncbi:MAG: hypothetical protein AAFR26_24970 [Cyanobacteria bacterium J06626_4]
MNEELFQALKKALIDLSMQAREYCENLSISGVEPDYWLGYEFGLEAALEQVKQARSELEAAFEEE